MANDGGPAFPHEVFDYEAGIEVVKPGMSLRAWLAGQALSGLVASHMGQGISWMPKTLAEMSIECADAVLAELAAGKDAK